VAWIDNSVLRRETTQSIDVCDLDYAGTYRCTLVRMSLVVELLLSLNLYNRPRSSVRACCKEREVMKHVVSFIVIVNLPIVELLRLGRMAVEVLNLM